MNNEKFEKEDTFGPGENASQEIPPEQEVYPTELTQYSLKMYGVAALVAVLAIAFAILFKMPSPLFILTGSAFLIYRASNVRRRYYQGLIQELAVQCTAIKAGIIRDKTDVSFCSLDPKPVFFKFHIATRKAQDDFIEGSNYIIYYDVDDPRTLLGYIQC